MVKINLNEHVKFILTEEGKKTCPTIPINPCTSESRLQLWEFCSIVGSYMHNGSCIVKNNTIVIGDENEHP
jgi:hypothetical protein